MRLDAFLEKLVQGYLFSDLDTMRDVNPPSESGRLGYPMFAACASGIELLGFLIEVNSTAQPACSQDFIRYWETYLYPNGPQRDAGMSIYQLIRNGIAHTFTSKAPTIAKHGPHLVRINDVARVNVVQLADDLRRSYYSNIRPIVDGVKTGKRSETFASMQQRLDVLLSSYETNYTTHQHELTGLPSAGSALDGLSSGATDDVRWATQSFVTPPYEGASNVSFNFTLSKPPRK